MDAQLYEQYCFETCQIINQMFPAHLYPPVIFIIDGAKSHKRVLNKGPVSGDNMATMREYLRNHPQHAPPAATWDEEATGSNRGKLSKDELWKITKAVKQMVPKVYAVAEIFRWGRGLACGAAGQGHSVWFTPPYHPELQ